MKYIDLHCDTLSLAFLKGKDSVTVMPEGMADVERLHKANVLAQFFAIFMLPEEEAAPEGIVIPGDDEYIEKLVRILHNTVGENPDKIALARNALEMEVNVKMNKVSAFLTIEDGRSVEGNMEKLEKYYDMGIRLISLTWNSENCFGSPNSTDAETMRKGLTPFGKEAVRRMEEMGMLVDVSHLSDGGFQDVADILHKPFVASHSNCREITGHPRNLTNEMIRTLADKGGVSGINFFGRFLNDKRVNVESRICDMVMHINHLVKYGGEDVVAIGSDFDGISGDTFDVKSPLQMELLFDTMKKEGYTERQIEKFAYGNAVRVIRDVLK